MKQSSAPAVGIDLGTTFSLIAHLDSAGRPWTIPNSEGDLITPSVVLFEGSTVVVGKEAVKASALEPERIAQFAKRDMGSAVYSRAINGEHLPPEVIQSLILEKLKRDAEAKLGPFKKAVITVPAYFNEPRRKATQDAGHLAGLEVIDIINEPTAAAIAYGFAQGFLTPKGEAKKAERLLVYDLGGGTFDVTLMDIDGKNCTVLATAGDVHLGGIDWDQRIVDYLADQFKAQFRGLDPRQNPSGLQRLLRESEDAKRALSARNSVAVSFEYSGHSIRVPLTRQQFETATADLVERTRFTTLNLLKEAGLNWAAITRTLLVGGSCRMPVIQEMLEKESGGKVDRSLSLDEAVCHGAAIYAGLLLASASEARSSIKIHNVNSHSLGVLAKEPGTGRNRNGIMIRRNTPLPATKRARFKTNKANQRDVVVNVIKGGDASGNDSTAIGKCVLRDLPPGLPAGTTVEVAFTYAENGRLEVKARLPKSNREATLTIREGVGPFGRTSPRLEHEAQERSGAAHTRLNDGAKMSITITTPNGDKVRLDSDSALIGRDRTCQIALPEEPSLQPIHAKIRKVANRWMVEAQGEWQIQVGTGMPGRMSWLQPGDMIRLTESGPALIFEEPQIVVQAKKFAPPAAILQTKPVVVASPRSSAFIRFTCPSCKMALQAALDQAGALTACPKCKTKMKVPVPANSKLALSVSSPPPAAAPQVLSSISPSSASNPKVNGPPESDTVPPQIASTLAEPRIKTIVASNPPKDPILMGILSLLFPWLGQFILGQTIKAIGMFLITPFVVVIFGIPLLAFGVFGVKGFFAAYLCFGLLLLAVNVLSAADAFLIAKKLRSGQGVETWGFFGLEKPLTLLPTLQVGKNRPNEVVLAVIAMAFVSGAALALSALRVIDILNGADFKTQMLIELSILHNCWALFAIAQMWSLKRHDLATLGSLLVMTGWLWVSYSAIPFGQTFLGLLAGASVGCWSLVVLRRPAVQATFPKADNAKIEYVLAWWKGIGNPARIATIAGSILTLAFSMWFIRPGNTPLNVATDSKDRDQNQHALLEPQESKQRELPAPREAKQRDIKGWISRTKDEIRADDDAKGITANDLLRPQNKANVGAQGKKATFPDFSKTDYSMPKVDYTKGPEGQKLEIMKETMNGELVESTGYYDTNNRFIRHGKMTGYFPGGQKKDESWVFNNLEHGEHKEWYDNGQLSVQVSLKDNRPHGKLLAWHKNGKLEEESNNFNGKLHGTMTKWYANGQKSAECIYANGVPVGGYTAWNRSGKKITEVAGQATDDIRGNDVVKGIHGKANVVAQGRGATFPDFSKLDYSVPKVDYTKGPEGQKLEIMKQTIQGELVEHSGFYETSKEFIRHGKVTGYFPSGRKRMKGGISTMPSMEKARHGMKMASCPCNGHLRTMNSTASFSLGIKTESWSKNPTFSRGNRTGRQRIGTSMVKNQQKAFGSTAHPLADTRRGTNLGTRSWNSQGFMTVELLPGRLLL
jgi:molecular chaperone DnaK